ncbi:hypothetical protein Tco_1126685 [Tanacetum coccineum]
MKKSKRNMKKSKRNKKKSKRNMNFARESKRNDEKYDFSTKNRPKSGWFINSPSFMYKELAWLSIHHGIYLFLGAKGLTSPEQTATGKGISNPLMAVMVCQKPYGIQLTNVSRVNTPGSDENRLKLYDLMYIIVKVADMMDC